MSKISAKPKLSKKENQDNALNDKSNNPPKKTTSIYRKFWTRNNNNTNTMQQGNSNNPDIIRLEQKMNEMHKDLAERIDKGLAERIDNGFLNLQAFLENLFSRYFSKSNENQQIPRNKAHISREQKGLKESSEDYGDYISSTKKGLKRNSEDHEDKKYELEQISFSSHSNKSEAHKKRIVRTNDYTAPKASKKEHEKAGLLSRLSEKIRVSNDFYSKNDTIPSIRKRYLNLNKQLIV